MADGEVGFVVDDEYKAWLAETLLPNRNMRNGERRFLRP